MRTTTSLLLACVALAACGPNITDIDGENTNPLTASRYGDELADTLANLIINRDPVIEQPGMEKEIGKEIAKAKAIGQAAREIQVQGMMGTIITWGQDAGGMALYVDDTLYFSTDFYTDPGPDLRVYLTETVDPRDGEFPDETAVDLGVIQSAYGAQIYAVPKRKDPYALRTLVLWDAKLGKIYGFSQLGRR